MVVILLSNQNFCNLLKMIIPIWKKNLWKKQPKKKQLLAFRHNGFWQCMDTKRDKEKLEKFFKEGKFFLKKKF